MNHFMVLLMSMAFYQFFLRNAPGYWVVGYFESSAETLLLSRGGVGAQTGAKRKRDSAQPQEMVLIKKMILLTSTTPAAATASAFPSSAEEGSFYRHSQ